MNRGLRRLRLSDCGPRPADFRLRTSTLLPPSPPDPNIAPATPTPTSADPDRAGIRPRRPATAYPNPGATAPGPITRGPIVIRPWSCGHDLHPRGRRRLLDYDRGWRCKLPGWNGLDRRRRLSGEHRLGRERRLSRKGLRRAGKRGRRRIGRRSLPTGWRPIELLMVRVGG